MYDHTEDYCSLTCEYWCDLLSTIKVKDESKIASVQINNIASAVSASLYDRDESMRIPMKKNSKPGVLRSNKSPKRAHSRHHGIQRYCVLCNKSGMPERKYTSYSAKYCTGVHNNRTIKDGMGRPMGSRTDAVKQYNNSENKWNKELKALKKYNKMIYIIVNKSGSRRDIKKIRGKYYKKTSDSSSDDLDSDS